MLLRIYKIISYLIYPFVPIYLKNRLNSKKELKDRINERYGYSKINRKKGKLVWLHAASIGESISILPVVEELGQNKKIKQILVTTGTVTSAKIMGERLKGKAFHQFLPIDIPIFVERFLNHWNPSVSIFVESEIWPNFISALCKRNSKLMILNGRMTVKSFNSWLRFKKTALTLFSNFDLCCAQSNDSAFFYESLGIKKIVYTGNLKFSSKPEKLDSKKLNTFKRMVRNRKILLAASTHEGEEEIIANITLSLKKKDKNFLSIIVPRHPNRTEFFSNKQKLKIAYRSKNQNIKPSTNIYIADTVGELNLFYESAHFVFVGGSLVSHGGQNPIEAALYGKTIIHGPNIKNFVDVYEILNLMKLTSPVNNEKQLKMYIEDNYKKTDISSTKLGPKRIKKEGEKALLNSMNAINQLI
tara:strand:- start:2040 stop:3284 length:1245 start_codon:yes stop_codon:yes gene_type:complete